MLIFLIAQGIEFDSDLFVLICASCYLSLQHRGLRMGFVQPSQLKPAKCKHAQEQLEIQRAKSKQANKPNPPATAEPEPLWCDVHQEEFGWWNRLCYFSRGFLSCLSVPGCTLTCLCLDDKKMMLMGMLTLLVKHCEVFLLSSRVRSAAMGILLLRLSCPAFPLSPAALVI